MDYLLLAIVVIIVCSLLRSGIGKKKKTHQKRRSTLQSTESFRPGAGEKAAEDIQKRFVLASIACDYQQRPILNQEEQKVYWILRKYLMGSGYYINLQVSLGEILTCKNDEGFSAINSKRCDFTITNKQFMPVAVVEFHGSGHYQGNYKFRDETKKNAVISAGIDYLVLKTSEEAEIGQVLKSSGLIRNTHQVSSG